MAHTIIKGIVNKKANIFFYKKRIMVLDDRPMLKYYTPGRKLYKVNFPRGGGGVNY